MMKKYVISLTAALVFLGLLLPLRGSEGSELPPSLLGYLRVENPDLMITGLEGFLQGLEIPPLAAAALKMGLGGMIENPNLAGVDLAGPLVLASFRPDRSDAWAVSFALSSPEAYQRLLDKRWKPKSGDEAAGIRIYSQETKEFDSEAFAAATPEERIDVQSFYRTGEKILAVAMRDKRVWVALDPEILKEVAPLQPADFPAPMAGDLLIGLRPQPLLDIAEESLGAILKSPAMSAPAAASPLGPATARAMNRAYLNFYLHYARQIENVFYGVTLNGSGIKVEEMFQVLPGTGLANFLSAQKKGQLSLARFLEPSPWMAATGHIDRPKMLLVMYTRFLAIFDEALAEIPESGSDREAADRLAAVWKSYISLLKDYFGRVAGDEMAFSVSSSAKEFISVVSLQEIRDRDAYREYIKKSFLSNRELLTPFYAGLGIAIDDSGIVKPENFQGTEIYTLRMTFDFTKFSGQESLSEDRKKIFARMESPLVIQFAATGDLAVTEMSWGGEPDIKKRLETIASQKSTFNTDQLGAAWSSANGVVYFSCNRFLKDFLGPLIEQAAIGKEEMSGVAVLRALGELDLPLVSYLTADGPTLKATTDISMEKIQSVKAAVEEVQAEETAEKTGEK